ncbi:hypothetical protein ACIRL2_50625 [Embleya sp. NPDC127516]
MKRLIDVGGGADPCEAVVGDVADRADDVAAVVLLRAAAVRRPALSR